MLIVSMFSLIYRHLQVAGMDVNNVCLYFSYILRVLNIKGRDFLINQILHLKSGY